MLEATSNETSYAPQQVAAILNVSLQSVYDLIHTGKLTATKRSVKRWVITGSAIDNYLINLNPVAQVVRRAETQHIWFYDADVMVDVGGVVISCNQRFVEWLNDANKIYCHAKYKGCKYIGASFESLRVGDALRLISYSDNTIEMVVENA